MTLAERDALQRSINHHFQCPYSSSTRVHTREYNYKYNLGVYCDKSNFDHITGLIPSIALSVWTSHPGSVGLSTAYASYFINYLCLGTALPIFSWLSDVIPRDPEARSLIVGVAVAGYYAVSAWSQVFVWPESQAPYYRSGWQTCIAIWVLIITMTCLLRWIDVKYLKPKRDQAASEIRADHLDGEAISGKSDVTLSMEGDSAIKGTNGIAV